MKTWYIPVTWEEVGIMSVKADSLEGAIDKALNDDSYGLPGGNYVGDSFDISMPPEDIREFYNDGQTDEEDEEV